PVTAIAEARRAVRWDDWAGIAGPIATFIRDELGVRSTVGTPIVVEGRMWGVLAVHSRQPLPQDSEARMEQFSNLVATAIANAEAGGGGGGKGGRPGGGGLARRRGGGRGGESRPGWRGAWGLSGCSGPPPGGPRGRTTRLRRSCASSTPRRA